MDPTQAQIDEYNTNMRSNALGNIYNDDEYNTKPRMVDVGLLGAN